MNQSIPCRKERSTCAFVGPGLALSPITVPNQPIIIATMIRAPTTMIQLADELPLSSIANPPSSVNRPMEPHDRPPGAVWNVVPAVCRSHFRDLPVR